MKKIIATLLAAAMVLSMCACGGSSSGSSAAPAAAASSAKSEAPAAAASSAKSEAPAAAASSAKSEAPAAEASSAESDAPAAADIPEVSADGPTFNLKFASTENEGTLRYQMLEKPIMELITERTNGRITFTFFPSSSLVGSGAVIKGCQDGTCDIGTDNINSYPGVFLYSELMSTPGVMLGTNFDEKAANIKAYCDAYATQEYKDNGIYLLGTCPALDTVLMCTFPVNSTSDYAGKTICCNATYAKMFEDNGAATTWTVPPEQYEAFHLNVIDGTINGSGVLQAFKLYEVLDHAYSMPFATITSTYVMSQKVYDSMPEDLQAALDAIQFSDELIAINKAYVEAMNEQVAEACKENANFAFAEFPADVAASMQESCAAGVEAKVAELKAAGLDADGAKALLDSFSK
ncbi:MAG: TRAP transporter substrate-binding protein DctP [Lachnospiraceae bacterium]|nr:TRAP transporter substrate-binding protein DctP [Lachnospiraceae bacterium]